MHRFSNVHKTNTEIESLLRSNDIPKNTDGIHFWCQN